MNICLLKYGGKGGGNSCCNLNDVMMYSLLDLNYNLVGHEEADIVIAIRSFPKDIKRQKGKRYILYQIEQYESKVEQVESFYAFNPDEIWGFDIDNERETYVPLGYHPCLNFKPANALAFMPSNRTEDIDVSLIGCFGDRRGLWNTKVKNKWVILNTFDDKLRGKNILRTKINFNMHYYKYKNAMFTEWGRISYFLANDCFFISEKFYCPFDVPQFSTIEEYDMLVDYYLNHPELRAEKGREMGQAYRSDFDMRNILKEKLLWAIYQGK